MEGRQPRPMAGRAAHADDLRRTQESAGDLAILRPGRGRHGHARRLDRARRTRGCCHQLVGSQRCLCRAQRVREVPGPPVATGRAPARTPRDTRVRRRTASSSARVPPCTPRPSCWTTRAASSGSFNVDPRSKVLNTEMGVLFEDPVMARATARRVSAPDRSGHELLGLSKHRREAALAGPRAAIARRPRARTRRRPLAPRPGAAWAVVAD